MGSPKKRIGLFMWRGRKLLPSFKRLSPPLLLPWPQVDSPFRKKKLDPLMVSAFQRATRTRAGLGWAGWGWAVTGTCCQCRSFTPGLQEMLRIGMCCLNLSILIFKFSAKRLGAGTSAKVLVNLYIVLHIFPICSAISSAFSNKRGPEIEKMGLGKGQITK